MNLPNKLTMARIGLIPVFVLFVSINIPYRFFITAVVFAVASFTDYLDGHIARKQGIVTDFGKFADPLADKILTTTAIVYLVVLNLCHPVVLILIITREFAVSGIRMIAAGAKEGTVIAANIWGKVKTVLQMLSVIVVYTMLGVAELQIATNQSNVDWAAGSVSSLMQTTSRVSHILMWLIAVVTVLSGVQYIWQNRHFIDTTK